MGVAQANVDRAIELFALGQGTEIVLGSDEEVEHAAVSLGADEDEDENEDEIKMNDDVQSDAHAQLHETSGQVGTLKTDLNEEEDDVHGDVDPQRRNDEIQNWVNNNRSHF